MFNNPLITSRLRYACGYPMRPRCIHYATHFVNVGSDKLFLCRKHFDRVFLKNPTLAIPVRSKKQWGYLFDAQESLAKAGVTFDSSTSFRDRRPIDREWQLDWSLKGATMRNPRRHPFSCPKCGATSPVNTFGDILDKEVSRTHPYISMMSSRVCLANYKGPWRWEVLPQKEKDKYRINPVLGAVASGVLAGVGLGIGFATVNWGKKRLFEKNPVPGRVEKVVFSKGTKKDGCRKVILPGERVANRWGRIICMECDRKEPSSFMAVYSSGFLRPWIFEILGKRRLQCGDTLIVRE